MLAEKRHDMPYISIPYIPRDKYVSAVIFAMCFSVLRSLMFTLILAKLGLAMTEVSVQRIVLT